MSNTPIKNLPKPKQKKSDKLERLIKFLESFPEEPFTGFIRINFSQGNVGRIEKYEEIYTENKELK